MLMVATEELLPCTRRSWSRGRQGGRRIRSTGNHRRAAGAFCPSRGRADLEPFLLQFVTAFSEVAQPAFLGALSLVIPWLSEARQYRASRDTKEKGKTRLANESIPGYLHTLRNVRRPPACDLAVTVQRKDYLSKRSSPARCVAFTTALMRVTRSFPSSSSMMPSMVQPAVWVRNP